jgi:peptide/nickel transport system substrate-binding protein
LCKDLNFHDGTPFNADAVKVNIERNKTLPGSVNALSLSSVTTVTVVDPYTARLNLAPGMSGSSDFGRV